MGRGLNIVSWNVASWKTTVQQLDSRHASASERGLDAWLRSLGADVLCLQEVKLMSKDLYQDPKGLGTAPGGYETFWACNDGKGAQTRGLNGVGAYVRAGLVVRSSCVALGESDLNDEGRCLLLELRGGLVIVSVYVPNDGSSSSRVRYKLRFLDALVALLARERAAGKTVVLLGDLNLKTRPADNYWSHRRLDLAAIASAHHAGTLDQASLGLPAQPSWQTDERVAEEYAQLNTRALSLARALGEGLEAMQSALAKAEVRPHKTKNPANGECFDKFKLFVPVGCSDKWRAVGSAEETEAEARSGYNLTGCTISATGEDGMLAAYGHDELIEFSAPGEMYVGSVCEVAAAVLDLENENYGGAVWAHLAASVFVRKSTPRAISKRYEKLLVAGGGLVDSFAHVHPEAQERFTCWNQYTQQRFSNCGSRLDYILAPAELIRQPPPAEEQCALDSGDSVHHPYSAAAALAGSTASGRWRCVDFGGGGFVDGRVEDYSMHLRRGPHTGILYTPPQYSDHVAVSVVLEYEIDDVIDPLAEATTRSIGAGTQPHAQKLKEQSSFKSYFTKMSAAELTAEAAPSASAPAATGAVVQSKTAQAGVRGAAPAGKSGKQAAGTAKDESASKRPKATPRPPGQGSLHAFLRKPG